MTRSHNLPWRKWEYAAVSLLLLMMGILAVASSRRQSITYDEVAHVPAGLSYLEKHDARLNIEHPPLLKMIAAAPLLAADVHANYSDRSWCSSGGLDCQWAFGRHFFTDWNRDPAHIIFLARLPMILLTLVFGLAVYWMARQLAGPWGALLSLAVFATSPFCISYGELVITDMGLALFCLLTAWFTADVWMRPSVFSVLKLSLAAAAALLSKYSAVLIVPSIALFGIWMWIAAPADRQRAEPAPEANVPSLRKASLYVLISGLLTLVLVWGFYSVFFYRSSSHEILNAHNAYVSAFRPPDRPERLLAASTWVLEKHPGLEKPLQPLWLYMGGIGFLDSGLTRPMYLLGKRYGHGVWYYFPVMTFFKLAPGEILLLLGLAGLAAVRLWQEHFKEAPAVAPALFTYDKRIRLRALLSFVLVFLAAAMRAKMNIGVRHISVPLLILVVLLALIVPYVGIITSSRMRTLAFTAVIVLAICCAITAFTVFPDYISYYNDFRLGMPKQEIATESNLDWGQSLPAVAAFAARHQISTIYVDGRMTILPPALYVPQAKPWKCDNPGPEQVQWAAVSANYLLRQEPTCIGLMKYEKWMLPGDAMMVFHITDDSYAENRRQYAKAHPTSSVAPQTR
jgi:hypothetical protein